MGQFGVVTPNYPQIIGCLGEVMGERGMLFKDNVPNPADPS